MICNSSPEKCTKKIRNPLKNSSEQFVLPLFMLIVPIKAKEDSVGLFKHQKQVKQLSSFKMSGRTSILTHLERRYS